MDTATLTIADTVLRTGSIRVAARALERPPASIAAAMVRIETELAVPLVQKAGSALMLTLEGTRLMPRLSRLADLIADLFASAGIDAQPEPAFLASRMISLDALARLLAVVEAGSIRAAARALGLGQPQLTRQIAHVEAVLGFPVLQRLRHGAVATPAGLRAIEQIRRIEDLWRDLANASEERFRRTETIVRIGSVIPLGPDSQIAELLADLAARWRLRHPRQPLFMSSMIAEDLLNGVRRGLFDVVLLDVESLPEDLDGRLISTSPLALVGQGAEGQDPADMLTRHPVAIPSLRSGLRQQIDRVFDDLFGAEGQKPIEIVEVDSIPVILKMVGRHGFVSILPSISLSSLHGGGPQQIRLDPRYSLPLWIAWPKARTGKTIARQVLSLIG